MIAMCVLCSATQDLKYNDVALPDPESQPYPWVGRADRDLLKWQETARNFQRRQREKAIFCFCYSCVFNFQRRQREKQLCVTHTHSLTHSHTHKHTHTHTQLVPHSSRKPAQ